MVLLLVFISAFSIMAGNLLQEYLVSDASESDRFWVWQHYGTAHGSFYTFYELTFAGRLDGWCLKWFRLTGVLCKEIGRPESDQPLWQQDGRYRSLRLRRGLGDRAGESCFCFPLPRLYHLSHLDSTILQVLGCKLDSAGTRSPSP